MLEYIPSCYLQRNTDSRNITSAIFLAVATKIRWLIMTGIMILYLDCDHCSYTSDDALFKNGKSCPARYRRIS